MSKIENPPAFPHLEARDPSFAYVAKGMTLRDWFAGQALAGMELSKLGVHADGALCIAAVESAYAYADAMLAIRQQERGHE
jgi:hypothetical protein